MKNYGLENIRNLSLLSHSGAGKTSVAEAILFTSGVINRLGNVEDGTTTSDYDPDEVKRQISINLTLLPCEWQSTKINLIDTPGYSDFVGEVKAAIRVSEGVVVIVCATSGVEVGTEQVWKYCEETELPHLIFVNKMDRENADFYRTVEELQAKFGSKCVPLQLPIGDHDSFEGVVDLLTKKAFIGSEAKDTEIPASLQNHVNQCTAIPAQCISHPYFGTLYLPLWFYFSPQLFYYLVYLACTSGTYGVPLGLEATGGVYRYSAADISLALLPGFA